MALPPGFLDDLRSRVSITQVVGRKVAWDSRKSNAAKGDWWAPCPFHQEKTASFHVDEAKGFYYCFGCHAKGDALNFLRDSENLGFIEAVELLAREAGVPMPDRDPAAAARAAAVQGLAEAIEAAVPFYRLQLATARASAARAYLDQRGVSDAARDRFEIGYAPDGRTGLLDHLTAKGFRRETLVEAGLVGEPQDGGAPYDRFRGRIMFPIRDARGRAIAFGARALSPGQEPKYLNSPETPLFDKGRSLYNAGPARAAAGKAGTLIVAEGYMDVIALVEAGFAHAVAPLGTAITADQLALMWKISPEPVVALDGDDSGQNAAGRLVDLALPLLAPGRALRFARLPAGQDPDDLLRAGGPAAMAAVLDASQPMIDLLWARETAGRTFDSPERRADLDRRLRERLALIPDAGLRSHYEAELRVRRAALFAPPPRPQRKPDARRPDPGRPGAGRGRGSVPLPPAAPSGPPSAATLASLLGRSPPGAEPETRVRECVILAGCLNHPKVALAVEDRLERMPMTCPDLAPIRDALVAALAGPLDTATVRAAVAARTGADPDLRLLAPGQVRAHPHLGPHADPDLAARAIDEELTRHAAATGWRAELRDAERTLSAPTPAGTEADEGLTWRLREAATAAHDAATRPITTGAEIDSAAEGAVSDALRALVEGKSWVRKNRR